jgi:hypothetical protein
MTKKTVTGVRTQDAKANAAGEVQEDPKKGNAGGVTAIAEASQQGTALAGYGEYVADGEDGFGNTTAADYALPFVAVLQSNSPQCKPVDNGGIDGAVQGMLMNTVTGQLYKGKEGFAFVPALTEHCYVEWLKRDGGGQGGGFVARHELESEFVKKLLAERQGFGKIEFTGQDGKLHELVETFYTYGVIVNEDGTTEKVVIGWVSTKIKRYRQFLTMARSIQIVDPKSGRKITPPLFAHRFRVRTVLDKNPKGEFFNFVVGFDGKDAASCRLSPDDPVFQEAYALQMLVKTGAAKASYDTQQAAGDEAEDTGASHQGGGTQQADGGKPPF